MRAVDRQRPRLGDERFDRQLLERDRHVNHKRVHDLLKLENMQVRRKQHRWRLDYNHHRIHRALDYQTPSRMWLVVFYRVRPGLSLQNTAEVLNSDSLTQTRIKTGRVVNLQQRDKWDVYCRWSRYADAQLSCEIVP